MTRVQAIDDDRTARVAWSLLVEPGDAVAGALVAAMGAPAAWAWLIRAAGSGEVPDPLGRDDAPGPVGQAVEAPGRARLARALDRWLPRLPGLDVDRPLDVLHRMGGAFLVPGDPAWPAPLDDLGPAAPVGLWVRGRSELAAMTRGSVAVVGARAATTYGERVAHDLAAGLADERTTVVSGGAFGIDAAAHRGSLARGGPTVVVLAGGVDRATPAGNARLIEAAVADGGAVVAEVPVGRTPTRSRFLQRNRLIAALAAGTVVVEAAWRSGALSTAHHAAGLLRPVGAVPGPVTSVASAGCHRLLRDGVAVCVTDVSDVLELVRGPGVEAEEPSAARPGDELPEHARRILDAASRRRSLDVTALAVRAGVSLDEARGALGMLELEGAVERVQEGWRLASAGPGRVT